MARKRDWNEMKEARFDLSMFTCVGLDTDYKKLPKLFHRGSDANYVVRAGAIEAYNYHLLMPEVLGDMSGFYKPNIAFYEAHGAEGLLALKNTIDRIQVNYPNTPVILDFKRADIGNTNEGYAEFAFDYLKADAITVNPYFGGEALEPFLRYKDKGVFVLCKTSNPGSGEFQNLVQSGGESVCFHSIQYDELYKYVAHRVGLHWNVNKNCGLVVGATYPQELEEVRGIVGDEVPILIPGIGKQGGDLKKAVHAGQNSKGRGFIINSSSGVIFAGDPRLEAWKLHESVIGALLPNPSLLG